MKFTTGTCKLSHSESESIFGPFSWKQKSPLFLLCSSFSVSNHLKHVFHHFETSRHGFCLVSPPNWICCTFYFLHFFSYKKTNRIKREKEISRTRMLLRKKAIIHLMVQDHHLHRMWKQFSVAVPHQLAISVPFHPGQKCTDPHLSWWGRSWADGSEAAQKTCDES